MKTYIFPIIFLSSLQVLFAQLKLYPLQHDPCRSQKNFESKSKSARIAASTYLVRSGVSVAVKSGHLLRCPNDNTPIEFEATVVNGGDNPEIFWYKNGLIVAAGSLSYTLTNPANKDTIYCLLNSSSTCVKNTQSKSNVLIVTDSVSLTPSVKILVTAGNDPDCDGSTPITLRAECKNEGQAPQFQWFLGNTMLGANTPSIKLPSLLGSNFVKVRLKSSINCPYNLIDTASAFYYRKINRIINPTVNLQVQSVTNNACQNPVFEFVAKTDFSGKKPIFRWYLDNRLVFTDSLPYFRTQKLENGSSLLVTLQSGLPCVNPKIVSSPEYIRADTLNLPFFDDFANSGPQPDNKKWIQNEGTFINNRYPFKPYTPNVATFDGLRQSGSPYDTINITSRAITDKLTSLPIDLSRYTASDAVGLHFLFQPQGIGEAPEITQGDYLSLSFLNSNGNWIEVWNTRTDAANYILNKSNTFKKKVIPVTNSASNVFLHSGFQFKFESFGRVSGSFDIWNVDYIYLNKQVDSTIFFLDQSFGIQPGRIFKTYSAIPVKHINNHKNKISLDTLYTNLNNLDNNFNNLAIGASFLDKYGKTFGGILEPSPSGIITIESQVKDKKVWADVSSVLRQDLPVPTELWYSFYVSAAGDLNNSDGKGINYQENNTISGTTYLDNFYAYDDGSAEYGIGLNYKFGQLAYRFKTFQPDTLKTIAINFTKLGQLQLNQSIILCVWKDTLPANPQDYNSVAYRRSVLLKYPDGINQWVVYPLETPLPVNGTFYIGYQQFTDGIITVGFDKNFDASSHIFYSNPGNQAGWSVYADTLHRGSLLMRPVFGNFRYVASIEKSMHGSGKSDPVIFYPNPISDLLYASEPIDFLQVFDFRGIKILETKEGARQFDFTALPSGLYLLRYAVHNRWFTTRIQKL